MPDRRAFITTATCATVGIVAGSAGLLDARAALRQVGAKPGKRREVTIGGRRVKTVDLHAHCFVPEVGEFVKNTPLAQAAKGNLRAARARQPAASDRHGRAGHRLPGDQRQRVGLRRGQGAGADLVALQNQRISQYCAKQPDRFVGMATLALQHPDLAAEQLDHAVKKLGMRGAAIGGSVEGVELSDRKFDPFWAKAQELGVPLFMHPQPAPGTTQNPRLQGKGGLGNTIGNPLETTVFLSHLIFEGTLIDFPGLKICAAHAGGYLASYSGRSDALCGRAGGNGDDCSALKKKPSEYFRRELLVDTMIFREDGLRHLIAEAGVGQIVYGTDYPFDWPVGVDFVLNAKFLSNADKEAILGGNAMKLLKIA